MLSLYEILKASKTGIAPDMWTALAGMNWGGADSGHEVKELTGIPPLSFAADGTPLLDYLISGNTIQNGTGTPDSPVMPKGCGDLEATGEHAGQYKIPISSGGVTTNIYLGSTQTVRKIYKIEYTGAADESWNIANSGTANAYAQNSDNPAAIQGVDKVICTHYEAGEIYNGNTDTGVLVVSNGGVRIRDTNTASMSVDSFKTYLQQQYAAGTPVTVWYVLATPETAAVNEPLMMIGNYSDTLSMEQAGMQIPTNRGNTVIDVDTTLKPSQMYIKYRE